MIYSLRQACATSIFRYGSVNVGALASSMGASTSIIFRHYRHIPNPEIADLLGESFMPKRADRGYVFRSGDG